LQNRSVSTAHGSRERDGESGSTLPTISRKLVHRHGDPRVERQTAESVIQH